MSQQVQINYQQIAVQCNSVCEVAEAQLKTMEEMLERIKTNSSTLLNAQTAALEKSIMGERDALTEEIQALRALTSQQAKQGIINTNNHDKRYEHRNDSIEAARRLKTRIDMLASKKLVEFNGLLDMLLSKSISESYERLRGGDNGMVVVDSHTQALLDSIPDEVLRQFTYLAYLQTPSLAGEELLAAGKSLMGQTFESRMEAEKQKIRAELEAARIDRGTIEKVMKKRRGLS